MNLFMLINEKLVTTPIIISPNWELLFDLMCDVSDYVVRTVIGK